MQRADLAMVLSWRNHISVRQNMFGQSEISSDDHQNWFEAASQNAHKFLFVFENETMPAGFVNFSEHHGIADWGFYLAPDAPRGSGQRLGLSALDRAFGPLKFHKVCGQVIDRNTRSIRFHEKLGFKQEGRLRESYLDGETYRDVVHFGLLNREWDPAKIEKEANR